MRFLDNPAIVPVHRLTGREADFLGIIHRSASGRKRQRCSFPAGFAVGLIRRLNDRFAFACNSRNWSPGLSGKVRFLANPAVVLVRRLTAREADFLGILPSFGFWP